MPFADSLSWHFAGLVLTIFLAALQGRIGRVAPLWQVVSSLPGTVLHELSHFLIALVTGGKPCGFTIIPRCHEYQLESGGTARLWTLGSVTMRNAGPLSSFPTALAPLFLNIVAWYLYRHWAGWFPHDLPHTLCLYVAVSVLCSSSLPSGQDMKVAFSSLLGLLLYGALIGAGILFRHEIAALLG
ncbi:MAG TPA: hypothetical protein VI389_02620 [Geobacteraceae bacterium]